MKQIALAHTGRLTSQLGFGCSSLMGATGRKASLALLEHAFESGICHFDVAPMYGYGAAEGCLGEFLARHRGEVTVASKFGLAAPANQGLLRSVRRSIGPLLQAFPAVKRRLASAANNVVAVAPKAPFTAAALKTSLQTSLQQLRLSSLDLLLLHEAEAGDLADDGLLRALQELVQGGTIGAFGCGSPADQVPALLAERPQYCAVLQFEWSILDTPVDAGTAFTLHHRALTSRFLDLHTTLRENTDLRRRWSTEVGADLAEPGMLAALMLKAALIQNPESVLLVSSRNPKHITENVRVAEDNSLADAAHRLYVLAQREHARMPGLAEPT